MNSDPSASIFVVVVVVLLQPVFCSIMLLEITCSALRYGVPQGSILGPLLFTLHIAPLQDVIARHNCNLNSFFYADDTQLYIAIDPANQALSLTALRNCIEDVIRWNTHNMIRNNAETDGGYIIYIPVHHSLPRSRSLSRHATLLPTNCVVAGIVGRSVA